MGCSGSRNGDDVFEREYRSCLKNSGELNGILSKLNFNQENTNPKKVSEILKKKDLISKYETDISKSLDLLNNFISSNNVVIGAGKADKEARVLAMTNNFETLKRRINELNFAIGGNKPAAEVINGVREIVSQV